MSNLHLWLLEQELLATGCCNEAVRLRRPASPFPQTFGIPFQSLHIKHVPELRRTPKLSELPNAVAQSYLKSLWYTQPIPILPCEGSCDLKLFRIPMHIRCYCPTSLPHLLHIDLLQQVGRRWHGEWSRWVVGEPIIRAYCGMLERVGERWCLVDLLMTCSTVFGGPKGAYLHAGWSHRMSANPECLFPP